MRNNAKFNNTPHDLHRGDVVLMRNEQKNNKLTPSFDPQPYNVVAIKGSMVTVSTTPGTGNCVTRNASFFKKIPHTFTPGSVEPELTEEEDMILERKMRNAKSKATNNSNLRPLTSDPRPPGKKNDASNATPEITVQCSDNRVTPGQPYTTRSGRTVKKPTFLKDFMK
jgi:hypothetical protein